jgi:DNA-binding XRE family transcriptional regulator
MRERREMRTLEKQNPGWWSIGRQRIGAAPVPGLKRVRLAQGLSVRKLADRVGGMSPDTIYRLEHMKQGAKPETRRKLAFALRTTQTDLFTPDGGELIE